MKNKSQWRGILVLYFKFLYRINVAIPVIVCGVSMETKNVAADVQSESLPDELRERKYFCHARHPCKRTTSNSAPQ